MKKEDFAFLNQLYKSLEEASAKLDEDFVKKDIKKFEETKKVIVDLRLKINGILENGKGKY